METQERQDCGRQSSLRGPWSTFLVGEFLFVEGGLSLNPCGGEQNLPMPF